MILSNEEILNCFKKWREEGDKEALNFLITNNTGLVYKVCRKYIGWGLLDFDELESAGLEGLFRAALKFNYNNGVAGFSTYATISIENQIRGDLRKIYKHKNVLSFEQIIGHDKNGEEIKVEDLIGTDADELIDGIISNMKLEIVKEALSCLTSREKQIIFLRYGLDEMNKKTQEEIASILGCSLRSIVNYEKKALTKMRHPKNTRKLKDFIE